MPLYSIAEVAGATGGAAQNVSADSVGSISIDSREIAQGALFVAIKGDNFDGHDFVGKAIEAGAAAALVSRERAGEFSGLPLIVVKDDPLDGLVRLARFNRGRSGALIVAVTGSVGKTSTKEAIRVALENSGRTHASIKSFNNHWGVPLMLARMPVDTQFGVFEIGMSSAGEITALSQLVRPHVAVITTVAPAHLEFFPSEEAIADAKAEIFAGLEAGGMAILGHDHSHIARLKAAAGDFETLTYGYDGGADVRITGYAPSETGGRADIAGAGLDLVLSVATPGRHTLANGLAALLVARQMGADLQSAQAAIEAHGAPEGRGVAFALGDTARPVQLIDESYNANPASMRAALDVFSQMKAAGGRKILVLGDMRELGDAGARYHSELRDPVLAAAPDIVFLVGAQMAHLSAALPPRLVAGQTQAVDDIAEQVLQTLAPGDSVMIKGSNGLKLGSLVARIRAQYAAPR